MNLDLDAKVGKWFWKNKLNRILLATFGGLYGAVIYRFIFQLPKGEEGYIYICLIFLCCFFFNYLTNPYLFRNYKIVDTKKEGKP